MLQNFQLFGVVQTVKKKKNDPHHRPLLLPVCLYLSLYFYSLSMKR